MPNASFAEEAMDLEQLVKTLERHAEELPQLQEEREVLAAAITQAKLLSARKMALTARLRTTTRELRRTMRDAKDLATRLRSGVKSRYGIHSVKLEEFGSRPRKRRDPRPDPVLPEGILRVMETLGDDPPAERPGPVGEGSPGKGDTSPN